MTTSRPALRARSAAGSLITPSCIETARARLRIASSTTGPAASELRKMSTRSTGSPISSSLARSVCPRMRSPAQRIHRHHAVAAREQEAHHAVLSRSGRGLAPTSAIVRASARMPEAELDPLAR